MSLIRIAGWHFCIGILREKVAHKPKPRLGMVPGYAKQMQ